MKEARIKNMQAKEPAQQFSEAQILELLSTLLDNQATLIGEKQAAVAAGVSHSIGVIAEKLGISGFEVFVENKIDTENA